jgi:diamine N-acetyltransferase
MTTTLRKANAEDAAIIAMLGRLTFRETFDALFVGREDELQAYLDQTFSVSKIASSMAKPQNHYYLAMLDALPVGYAKHKHPSANPLINDPAPTQLQKIYVLSEFIAHRIGHALLDAVIQAAVVAHIRIMWLTVLVSNDRAIRFYERHGWTGAGTANFAIGTQDFSFLVMRTEI